MFGLSPNFIFELPGLLIAMTVHEFAHAYVAHRLGDPTPRLQGRLTLNPVAHIDPMGLLMLVFFRFGWGRSVEVNPNYFRNYRKGMLWVSLAGPASNILLGLATAIVFGLLGRFSPLLLTSSGFRQIMLGLLMYNVYLAVFNLIPIPPLDGSKILFGILPAKTAYR
ncbi:MAG: site-2 protease family protein, partial [Bacillota bacterium]